MIVYADSSFFVSAYIEDRHSAVANGMLAGKPTLLLTPLHRAEWTHALSQHVFRGFLKLSKFDRLRRQFQDDQLAGAYATKPIPEHAFELCVELARQFGPDLGMRTLDTLHVACALELGAKHFWTFDERQGKLASAKGLKIV